MFQFAPLVIEYKFTSEDKLMFIKGEKCVAQYNSILMMAKETSLLSVRT